VEIGPVTDHVSLAGESTTSTSPPSARPEATARYLATGTVPNDPKAGDVTVLHSESPDEQIDLVADEIERLRDERGWGYDAFAVALNQSGSAVSETIESLGQAGVPTESTTVTGFGDDPAIRELLQVTRHLAGDADSPDGFGTCDRPVDAELLSSITAEEGSMEDVVRRWATESGLKARIAERESPLDARSQFGNVRRAFAMAEFLEDTEFIDASWETFAQMLERAHEHAPTETQTSATELDGGVRVDHLQALKNGSWRAVFVLNIVDGEFPGKPFLTRLFPQERVLDMPDFPGVTGVSETEVQNTFQTRSTASSQPVKQYHVEQSRRRLAVGANAASDQLYFCLYDHADSALDEQIQPSRFLTDAYRHLPWLEAESDETIRSERAAEEFVLSRFDRVLADVRRTQSRDVTVSLDAVEQDFGEIHRLLHESDERGEALRDALRARVDFAAGRVRRE
jgi:superfamily I DNA/RNA helicase